ncbi:MAG: sigma-70 family RNA polymerase sigma factor [Actinobacteria bacterium]|nr:MAG: sigma-70 family RNA polymerase sigma factor [Actinomycetota bacterium]
MAHHPPPQAARFDELFAAYSAQIFAYCRMRSRSVVDAEDALAEVFLVAWRRLDDIPGGDAARAWLYATARRVTANQLRSARRSASLLERVSVWRDDRAAYDFADTDETSELVHEGLKRLKPIDREVLLLAEWEQLSSVEIATVTGCSDTAARGRLHRARRRFREAFEYVSARRMQAAMAHSLDLTDSLTLAGEALGEIHD